MKIKRIRIEEARERAQARAKRTTAQQLTLISKRPGESKREKARLTVATKKG